MNIYRLRLILVLTCLFLLLNSAPAAALELNAVQVTLSGVVSDQDGPIAGAHVRVRATENFTTTNQLGEFTISSLTPGEEIELTAWSEGYYVASLKVTPPASGILLNLRPYHTVDHPDYTWTAPTPGSSDKACGNCHPLILPQWEANAHGLAISNARFFSMYNGTDTSGAIPVEPGFINDFPGTSGNCASCHAPGAAVDGYLTTDMNAVRGELTAGIHCDYCHKVGGVFTDPSAGNVYPNSPGVTSQRILRPPADDNIFIGPYDDIPDPDTYLPVFSESRFCAPCHQFSFWGTPIYESYTEWLESDYPAAGVTCQDCHMPPTGDEIYALPEVGGLPHPPDSIPSHLQVGAENLELLQEAVDLSLAVKQVGNRVQVIVEITNHNTGHHVPTDHPGRHLILSLEVTDQGGAPLNQLSGPQVPPWGGEQAGQPGVAYAKVLQDIASGEFPVVSYWKQTKILSDNRISANASDTSVLTFLAPPVGSQVDVHAELRFRRLFQDQQQAKGWDTPDVIMEQAAHGISIDPWWQVFLPLAAEISN